MILLEIIGGIVASLLAASLVARTERTVKSEVPKAADGSRTLRYTRAWAIMGWVGVLGSAALAAGRYFSNEGTGSKKASLYFVCAGILLASLGLLAAVYRSRLVWDEGGALFVPAFGSRVRFRWPDVTAVGFSKLAASWTLRLRTGRKVRIGEQMHGAAQFMRAVGKRTGLVVPSRVGKK